MQLNAFATSGSSPGSSPDQQPDLTIYSDAPHATAYLLSAATPAGLAWLEEHIWQTAPRLGDAVVVEHRFLPGVVKGAMAVGLVVQATGACRQEAR